MKLREALQARITAYLSGGGLFNPELANHDAVRDLLIECRDALAEPVADEPVAPINEGEAWSFCRKVIADGRDILAWHPDEGYERQSARMDAQAAKRADELIAALRAYVDADRAQRQEYSEAAQVCAEAYQVVGSLLEDLGVFDTDEAVKILDNLSEHRMVHKDVLPWPSMRPAPAPAECKFRIGAKS